MMKKLRNELLYYVAILVVLAFIWHPDLFTSPLTRVDKILSYGNYLHPFLWAFGVYLFIGFFRAIYSLINYLKKRGSK
jgi:hypothetical protein